MRRRSLLLLLLLLLLRSGVDGGGNAAAQHCKCKPIVPRTLVWGMAVGTHLVPMQGNGTGIT